MSSVCQHPFVNVFKQFGVGQWKRCCKEGDVSPIMDRDMKATVYRISGAVVSANYIQLPKATSQSLGLTGPFLHLLFRPLPSKFFSVHLEVATTAGVAVRISLSNIFKEFKSTSTWLQFPYSLLHHQPERMRGGVGERKREATKKRVNSRWTLLVLDLRGILEQHLNAEFAYLKNIQLCANQLVRGIFTSHAEYSPLHRRDSTHLEPLPREMRFPLGKTEEFMELYDYVRCPPVGGAGRETGCVEERRGRERACQLLTGVEAMSVRSNMEEAASQRRRKKGPTRTRLVRSGEEAMSGRGERSEGVREGGGRSEGGRTGNGVHIYAETGAEINMERRSDETSNEDSSSTQTDTETASRLELSAVPSASLPPHSLPPHSLPASLKSLEPDPIMRLSRVVGFGGHSTTQLLFPCRGCVVYPCHRLVVIASLQSREQRFLVGHTAKVSCLAGSGDGGLLASGQTGTCASVRLWDFQTGHCLSLFQTHSHSLSYLSLSHPGSVLCGVGRDRHGKNHAVLWNTAPVAAQATPQATPTPGEVSVLTQAHTDVSISVMKIAHFDEKRMVSCGRDNIRFWRVKGGTLRSCPVSLDSCHHQMVFTDVAFQPGYPNGSDIYNRHVKLFWLSPHSYACTRSGHVLEIHYSSVSLKRVWHLLPGNQGGVAITVLCLHEAFSVTGSEDGVLRVWPSDFSSPFLEAEHEAGVTAVGVSEDGMKILAATASGNIGVLDAGSHSYTTLMRSHARQVGGACLDGRGQHLLTCSRDNSIRVWDSSSGEQVFDFRSSSEVPLCVAHHPTQQVFACGFSSGAVRVFHTHTTSLLAEHCHHSGRVRSVLFSPTGHRLYSSCSSGSLAMFDSSQQSCPLLKLLGNMVAGEEGEREGRGRGREEKGRGRLGQQSMALSEDGKRLAIIGPLTCNITVLDALSLSEVLRLDITPMVSASPTHSVSSAHLVLFSPATVDQLLVVTSSSEKEGGATLLKVSASNGQLLSQVARVHRGACTAVSLTPGGRHILTAGDKSIKVWDYSMTLDLNFQVFIGHSDEISQILVTPDGRRVISTAAAVFYWDFLSHSPPPPAPLPPSPTLPHLPHHTSLLSVSPRVSPPVPTNYEPLKSHQFTPQPRVPLSNEKKSVRIALKNVTNTASEMGEWGRREGGGRGGEVGRGRGCEGGSGEEGVDESSGGEEVEGEQNGEVIIEHSSNDEVHIEVPSGSDQSNLSELSHDQERTQNEVASFVPVAEKHYKPHPPRSSLATHLYVAPPNQVGMERRAVLGMSGRGRGNVVWQPNTGLFAYSSGCLVVVEDLSNSNQTHLTGHSEEVSTLVAMGDGKTLASSSHAHDSTPCEIRIWKLSTNKCSKVMKFHRHAVTSMAFSIDDRFLLSLGDYRDNSLAVWSTYDYSLAVATSLSLPGHQLVWDPHTAYEFVTVGAAASLCFWILEEGTATHQLKVHETEIPSDLLQGREKSEMDFTAACYGLNNKHFIGSSIGVVSMWDTSQNKCIMFWKTTPNEIGSMCYCSGKLAVGSVSGTLALWGVGSDEGERGRETAPSLSQQTELKLDAGIFSLSFDQDMKLGVAGSAGGCVWYINWMEGTKVKLVSGHAREVVGVATSADGELLATVCRDGSVAVWNMDSLEQTVAFHAPKKECLCISFAPAPLKKHAVVAPPANEKGHPPKSSSPLAAAGYSDGSVRLFSRVSGTWSERKMKPHGAPVTKIAFSSDGRVILTGSGEGVVAASSVASGLVVKVIHDHRGAPVTDLAVVATPAQLASVGAEGLWLWACASGDRRVSVWSSDWTQDVCHLLDWLSFPGPPTAPNGSRLRKGDKGQYELLPPSLVRFSPSDPDTLLYTGYGLERCLQFYSLSQKTVLRKYAITHWATCMDISPLGHLIALGCLERVLKLMDYSEGSFQDFSGHSDSVSSLVFSVSGSSLISTSDSFTHIWTLLH